MFVSKNAMNPYQFMHQHKILDSLERIFEAIPRNVNIYKRGLDGIKKNCGDQIDVGLGKPFETIQIQ